MHRQYIKHGQRIIHDLSKPLRARFNLRKTCGPYYFNPPKAGKDNFRSFYLDSDFMPSLRYQFAHDVVNLRHTGWYCDNDQLDTICGIVFRLPHNRGFMAGWTMGSGMISEIETYIYDDETSAAFAADSLAENVAERNREANSDDIE